MTRQNTKTAKFGLRPRDLLITLVALGGIVAIAVAMLGRSGGLDLRRSAIGFEGLAIWLQANDIAAKVTTDTAPALVDKVGLRVLPLFDGDPNSTTAESQPQSLEQQDQADLDWDILSNKIELLPTLVILPKWRSGAAILGEVGPRFLRDWPNNRIPDLLGGYRINQLTPEDGGFADFRVVPKADRVRHARLYLPQVLSDPECEPIIGSRDQMVLGMCLKGETPFYLLSDPDLLNNHGLRLGDNSEIAKYIVPILGNVIATEGAFEKSDGTGLILIDLEADATLPLFRRAPNALPDASFEPEGPSLSELFAYPMSLVWASLAAFGFLVVWRGSVRVRPVLADLETGPAASKVASIEAQARLLRLSGHDSDLLFAHIDARLNAVTAGILGPQRRGVGTRKDPLQALATIIARRDSGLGARLTEAVTNARRLPDKASTAQVVDCLDQFEIAIEQVLHEFGRTAQPR